MSTARPVSAAPAADLNRTQVPPGVAALGLSFSAGRGRRVAKRTFSWLGRYRCPSKDHEHTPESSEAVVKRAAIHHMLRRLRPARRARSQRLRLSPRPRTPAAWALRN